VSSGLSSHVHDTKKVALNANIKCLVGLINRGSKELPISYTHYFRLGDASGRGGFPEHERLRCCRRAVTRPPLAGSEWSVSEPALSAADDCKG